MTEQKMLKTPSGDIPCHLLDMDGVLVRGMTPIVGSAEYVQLLVDSSVPFMVFSNNSRFTPEVMADRLNSLGFAVDSSKVYTSALTTAEFINLQKPNATCFPIGEEGLKQALNDQDLRYDDVSPDYVVVGEAIDYSFQELTKGAQLVARGARFVGTNPDTSIPSESGAIPACGAACALIEATTGVAPYFIGKPNPFMMRAALAKLGKGPSHTIMVGDRIDTDIIAGMELGLQTVLVLTGTSTESSLGKYPYRPDLVVPSLYHLSVHMGFNEDC